jgi:hypothetical protein
MAETRHHARDAARRGRCFRAFLAVLGLLGCGCRGSGPSLERSGGDAGSPCTYDTDCAQGLRCYVGIDAGSSAKSLCLTPNPQCFAPFYCSCPATVLEPCDAPAGYQNVPAAPQPGVQGPLTPAILVTQCARSDESPNGCSLFGPSSVLYVCPETVIDNKPLCIGNGDGFSDAGVMYQLLCCDLGD